MKLKYAGLFLLIMLLLLAGCSGKVETITFTAEIEKVLENSILVNTIDYGDFDKASVDLREAEYDFEPAEGQIVEVTIKPEIRESYPVQVTGVKLVYKGEAERKVADYFPFRENVKYTYLGKGNEYADYEVFTDYISGNRIQHRVDNGGTVMARVYEIRDGKLVRVYFEGEVYYRENMLNKQGETEEILLMEPLEKGTTWKLEDGSRRTLTGISEEVQTPVGSFTAIEVVTEGSNGVTIDYYAKGMGLVKSIFQSSGMEVSSTLESVEEDMARTQEIRMYYPESQSGAIQFVVREVAFRTNDDAAGILEEAYKGAVSETLGVVFTTNTAIKRLALDQEHRVRLDLNQAFVTEMNAGAAYEAMILQCVANTFGNYYNAERLILTIEGKPYESGHIRMEEGESIPVETE